MIHVGCSTVIQIIQTLNFKVYATNQNEKTFK